MGTQPQSSARQQPAFDESGVVARAPVGKAPTTGPGRKHDFLDLVSHELRNTSGVIAGLLDLVVVHAGELGHEREQQLLGRARANAHRMSRLLEDADAALRLGAGQFSFHLASLDLGTAVESTVTQVREVTGRDIHVLQLRPLPQVVADRDRQAQILTNLLSNAVAYSPEGSPIRVDVAPEKDVVAVRVRNSGEQATTEQLERLFDPFVRLDADRADAPRGTGLGLCITRMLVRGQGGSIWVESHRGGWSFTYTVPRADRQQPPPPAVG
jgi:signal transduction histidine kinase